MLGDSLYAMSNTISGNKQEKYHKKIVGLICPERNKGSVAKTSYYFGLLVVVRDLMKSLVVL